MLKKFFKWLFGDDSDGSSPKQEASKLPSLNPEVLANKAYDEIAAIVKNKAFQILYSKQPFDRYLDIRIEDNMESVSIANSMLENFFVQDPKTGKFSYPEPKKPPEVIEIAVTKTAKQLSDEDFLEYRDVLLQLLMRTPFYYSTHAVFMYLRDTQTIFRPLDLGQICDYKQDMIFTDF